MCHDTDAVPPVHGAPVTTVAAGPVRLTSADGTAFDGYLATPAVRSGPALLVLPDNRGLSGFYERLTEDLAGQGLPALALDYFGRTAGCGYRERGPEFADPATLLPRHLHRLHRDTLFADIDAGLARLRDTTVGPVVCLGFCLGGRFAFQTAVPRFGLAGVIGLYGALDPIRDAPGPIQLAHTFTVPVLGLFGGADDGIPADRVAAFDAALAGVPHELVTYPGAPHGFFEMQRSAYAGAQADAWQRILRFAGQCCPG